MRPYPFPEKTRVRRLKKTASFLFISALTTTFAVAAPAKPPVSAAPKSAALWNSWYTMTIGEKIHYGYYNDRVERRDGKLAYQNHLWKREEGFINEERVVSFGRDDVEITPLLFNFVGTYRESTLTIDGTFSGTKLNVKARKGKQSLPSIEAVVPKNAFLSTLFQAWIGRRIGEAKLGKRTSFITLFEDGLDNRYAPIHGAFTLEPEDDYARRSATKKLTVELAAMKSVWYVLPSGEAVRIEKPDQRLVIERKTEAEAKRFLIDRVDAGT